MHERETVCENPFAKRTDEDPQVRVLTHVGPVESDICEDPRDRSYDASLARITRVADRLLADLQSDGPRRTRRSNANEIPIIELPDRVFGDRFRR